MNSNDKPKYGLWRNKYLTSNCHTIVEMIQALHSAANLLHEMHIAGVELVDNGEQEADVACLKTTSTEAAQRFNLIEDAEEDC